MSLCFAVIRKKIGEVAIVGKGCYNNGSEVTDMEQIDIWLANAYAILGVREEKQRAQYVQLAQDYLRRDREHYIELTRENLPSYRINEKHGKICKLVPLAQRVIREQDAECVKETKLVLALMAEGNQLDFVYIHSYVCQAENPEETSYTSPAYGYADLRKLIEGLQVLPPQDIRPVATAFEWECYCNVFMAFAKLCKDQTENTIPHKTERAMVSFQYVEPEEITLDKGVVRAKLLPLASSYLSDPVMKADHRYNTRKELCLLTQGEEIAYVLRITHIYRYFKNVGGEDWESQDDNQKKKLEYRIITWDEIPEDIHPSYY